jgi:hypothetical protein
LPMRSIKSSNSRIGMPWRGSKHAPVRDATAHSCVRRPSGATIERVGMAFLVGRADNPRGWLGGWIAPARIAARPDEQSACDGGVPCAIFKVGRACAARRRRWPRRAPYEQPGLFRSNLDIYGPHRADSLERYLCARSVLHPQLLSDQETNDHPRRLALSSPQIYVVICLFSRPPRNNGWSR